MSGRKTVYNKIFTEEDWQKVNPKNINLMKDWLKYLKSVDRSPKSIEQYFYDMRIILIWILKEADNKVITDLNKKDIVNFQGYLSGDLGHSSSRVRRLKSCLSSFANFVENILDDLYPDFRNIVNKIESPPISKVRDATILTEEMVENALDRLVKAGSYQKACIFALAIASGARLSELVQFKVWYFDDKHLNGGIYKTPEKIRLKGKGKTGLKQYKYVLKSFFKDYYDLWMQEREKIGVDCEYLFVTRDGEKWVPAKDSTIQGWYNNFAQILKAPFYMHSTRHFLCTLLRKNNIPDKIIQAFFAWASPDMINTYDDSDAEDDFMMYFDEGGIVKQDKGKVNDL